MLIIAHRGSSASAPENTLAAFRRAAHEGADMVELDVRLSRDGVLVVHHDRRLGRTAPGREELRLMSLRELRRLDAGSWFSSRFRNERIPTLAQVMRTLPAAVGINIEVKTDGDKRRNTLLASLCVQTIRASRYGRPVLVSSFDHAFLQRLHALDPALPTGALFMPVRDLGKRPSRLARRLGVSFFICSCAQLRKRYLRDAQRCGMHVLVYGVETSRQLARAARYGVAGIMTDHPARLRALAGQGRTPHPSVAGRR